MLYINNVNKSPLVDSIYQQPLQHFYSLIFNTKLTERNDSNKYIQKKFAHRNYEVTSNVW